MNELYPVFLRLDRKRVLVVGGGEVAAQKLDGLLAAHADVTVITPHACSGILRLAEQGRLHLNLRPYAAGDAQGFFLVISATDDASAQRQVSADAAAESIPVNVVDVPALCSFYLGSVFREGDLTVAVSTNGKSPTLGQIIRDKIREEFKDGYPGLLETLGGMRDHLKRELPDYRSRKKVLAGIVRTELNRLDRYRKAGAEAGEGKVYLVGAGPGDPGLITVRGRDVLSSADVVLYDSLVSEELLRAAPPGAEKVFVGKKAGVSSMRQEDIHALLITKAREGKNVIRLKGGDPFVFGRGGEELEALERAGITVEIVPGITAGTGVPSAAGLPLTDRRYSSSVAFLTGHEDPEKTEGRTDWAIAAHADTVVIYMGLRRLQHILARLASHGIPETRPAAVIGRGTLDDEQIVIGTLSNIRAKVGVLRMDSPALIVVGDVVRLLEQRALAQLNGMYSGQAQEEQPL